MVLGNSPGKDMVDKLADVLSSPVLNVLVGMAGIAMPLIVWASHRAEATGIVLAAETTLLPCVVVSRAWLRRSHALVRRPVGRRMSDPTYFDLVRRHIESGPTGPLLPPTRRLGCRSRLRLPLLLAKRRSAGAKRAARGRLHVGEGHVATVT
jgi:hypothetical protein